MSITPDAITQTLVARETIAAGECVTASGHIARAPEDVFAVATAGAIAGKSLTCTTSGAALLAWDTTQIIDRVTPLVWNSGRNYLHGIVSWYC